MFKNLTLSGKKKLLATLFGVVATAGTAALVSVSPAYVGVAALITWTVTKYLNAETALDRQRAATTFLTSLLYQLKDMKFTPPANDVVGADNQFVLPRSGPLDGLPLGVVIDKLLQQAGVSNDIKIK